MKVGRVLSRRQQTDRRSEPTQLPFVGRGYRPDDDPDTVTSLRLLSLSKSTKSDALKHEMGASCGRARNIVLYSDVCIQKDGRSRRSIVYKQGLRMVNKRIGDEVEVVQLCKGGCQNIPGMAGRSFQLRQETRWLGSGRDRRGPSVVASSASLLPYSMLQDAMEIQLKTRIRKKRSEVYLHQEEKAPGWCIYDLDSYERGLCG